MRKKAYKFRLYPDKEQQILINKTFGCVRFIYNRILDDNNQIYKSIGKCVLYQPTKYKIEFDWLKEVDSLALCNARLNLCAAFTNFFRNVKQHKKGQGFPNFKSKKNPKQSYTTNNQSESIRIKNNLIRLPKVGFVKCKFHREIIGQIKSVTVSKDARKNYFISILTEQEANKPINIKQNKSMLGIDMSFRHFVVLSNGEKINPPKWYQQSERRLSRVSRKVSKCKLGSNNRQKARIRKAQLEGHTKNQRLDFLHKLSRRLVNRYDVIITEDIDMREMAKDWGKTVNNLGFGMFRNFLEYKCEEESKIFIKADKYFSSSQLCFKCGYKNSEVKNPNIKEWICPKCQAHHDRDLNACYNLINYYIGMERAEFTPAGDSVRLGNNQAVVVESGNPFL